MLASAMPQEKKRSGNSLAKYVVMVDLERSASHHHDVLVLAAQFHQRAAERFAGRSAQLDFEFWFCFGGMLLQLL